MRTCSRCKKSKPTTEFYTDNSKSGFRYICKLCDKARILAIQLAKKAEWVAYKGGRCERCGYNRYVGALDFHHRDPATKSFSLSASKMTRRSLEVIRAELDKCDLLCANCHREEHGLV